MSGICGIGHPQALLTQANVEPMLAAVSLPHERMRDYIATRSVAMGFTAGQVPGGLASIPGIRLVTLADPCNLAELRAEVSRHEAGAHDLSVAEVFAWLYKIQGEKFLLRPRGAFSLALWDEAKQRLLLAIDRFGIYSLYWCRQRNRLQFASRISGVRAAQAPLTRVNPGSILQYLLFSAIPAPLTPYEEIFKLEPGSFLVYDRGDIQQAQYWDMAYQEDDSLKQGEWAGEVRTGLRACVRNHLQGCRPAATGAYLSGGTDSSTVVAFMNEDHSPVNTFSIFFDDPRYSEIEFARITARCFQTRHYARRITPQEGFDAIAKLAEYFDEPFSNSSAVGAYYCALTARENGVDTLLAGDGGDELFAGNERYASDKRFELYHRLPSWARSAVIEPLLKLLPRQGKLGLPFRYVRRAKIGNPRRIMSYGFFLDHEPSQIFEPEFLTQISGADWLAIPRRHYQRAPQAASELNRLLYLDVKMTLADNDLRKVVGTAELARARVRFPLLDPELAALSGRIPTELKLKGFRKRFVFKQAMKGILPDRVLYKKKHGFGVPVGSWLLREARFVELMRDILSDPSTRYRHYFRRAFLEKLPRLNEQYPSYYGDLVWSVMMLELWHRQHEQRAREYVYQD